MIRKSSQDISSSILESARVLFWKHGIKRVTIEQICLHAGISKMSFYRNFSNKNDLIDRLIDLLSDQSIERYRTIKNMEISFPEKIKRMVEQKKENVEGMSDDFLTDIYSPENQDLANKLEKRQTEMIGEIRNDFIKAQSEGGISKELPIDFIMYNLFDLQNKVFDPKLNVFYSNRSDLILDLTRFFFYGISNRETI
ncbi:MAG: helix-turn-helix transcriptional regulator [Flavobacteriales bacterium]|nr:helix-turn-helix transcriptional regulator [Flavobacteriales bacterium]